MKKTGTSLFYGVIYNIRQRIKKWLGIMALEYAISENRMLFNEQMKMVGVDAYMHKKGTQSVVIFVSRLGNKGQGTVRILDTTFKDAAELIDFIRYTEHSFDPERVALDLPYMMGWPRDRKG